MTFWKKIIIRKTRDVNQEFCGGGGGGGKDQNPSLFYLFGRKEILKNYVKRMIDPGTFALEFQKILRVTTNKARFALGRTSTGID